MARAVHRGKATDLAAGGSILIQIDAHDALIGTGFQRGLIRLRNGQLFRDRAGFRCVCAVREDFRGFQVVIGGGNFTVTPLDG